MIIMIMITYISVRFDILNLEDTTHVTLINKT